MNGLARHERDAGLLARAGGAGLHVPAADELLALLRGALLRAEAPDPRALRWDYARWKPGQSLCLGWELAFESGRRAWVVWKRYQDGQETALEAHAREEPLQDALFRRGRAALDGRTWLSVFPCDRALPGLPRALDLQRRARDLQAPGGSASARLRWRHARAVLLRYKPERRAVLRLEWRKRAPLAHALRVLTLRETPRCLAARRAFEFTEAPRLVGTRAEHGLLYEEWLALEAEAPAPEQAGALLARLHALELPAQVPACPRLPGRAELEPLFELDPELLRGARAVPLAEPGGAEAWCHGDFHADQLGSSARGTVLLDLDSLGRAAPARDLASWIADAFLAEPAPVLDVACGALLEPYARAGGRPPEARELRAAIAAELLRRAAAGLRRLEAGALERAGRLLEHARACGAPRARALAPLERAFARLEAAHGGRLREVVERCDLDAQGGATLQLALPGGSRWFAAQDGAARELRLGEDPRLPGAAQAHELVGSRAAELVSWRPGRRFVVRLEGRLRKGLRAARYAAALRRQEQVWSASQGRALRVAAVVERDAARATFDLEELPGRALEFEVRAAPALARLLEDWQSLALPDLAVHGRSDELELLDRLADRHARAAGSLPAGWERCREALVPEREVGARLVTAHRDFHEAQLLVGPGELGLLDFDLCCRAEPELDPGNLLAHLDLARIRGRVAAPAAEAFERAFLAACAGRGLVDGRALVFHRGASLLRLALVWGLRARGPQTARALLQRAEALLDA
jgi:hypothetical protein